MGVGRRGRSENARNHTKRTILKGGWGGVALNPKAFKQGGWGGHTAMRSAPPGLRSPGALSVKTLKIVLLSRRNTIFFEIEHPTRQKKTTNVDRKVHVLGHNDFGSILEGFRDGLRVPKS